MSRFLSLVGGCVNVLLLQLALAVLVALAGTSGGVWGLRSCGCAGSTRHDWEISCWPCEESKHLY